VIALGKIIRSKKAILLFLGLFPFLIILISFLIIYIKPLSITQAYYSDSSQEILLDTYDDRPLKGKSEAHLSKDSSNRAVFTYMLKQGASSPFAGINYSLTDTTFFDVSAYDEIKIKIRAKYGTRIPIYLSTNIPDYSMPGVDLSYRLSLYTLNVSNQWNEITVPIKHFETPHWWYSINNKSEKDFGLPDFSKVNSLNIANCLNINKDIEDVIEVESIIFYVSFTNFYIYSGLFLAIYFTGGFLFLRKKKNGITQVNFQYEKLESVNHFEKEDEVVFGYITKNYSQQDLTITEVQNATGIHERKISLLIKKKTELNFKQFLNKLRVSEAKRLLSETDLQISEIAFKTGYGNASHFNRVFRSFEDCSPNDFRKDYHKSSTIR
jgi:AraC-like DNA-binding protein